MKVHYRRSFVKDLRALEQARLAHVREVIERVESATVLGEVPQLKKIRGHSNFFRIRLGDYRIGLHFDAAVVTLVRCLHRKEIYRYFP